MKINNTVHVHVISYQDKHYKRAYYSRQHEFVWFKRIKVEVSPSTFQYVRVGEEKTNELEQIFQDNSELR